MTYLSEPASVDQIADTKVEVSLCLNKYHAMKTHRLTKHHISDVWGSGGIAPDIPNLGTRQR
jgi:hypothetical protein